MPSEPGRSRNRALAVVATTIAAVVLLWLARRDPVEVPASSAPALDAGTPVSPGGAQQAANPKYSVVGSSAPSAANGPTEAEVQAFRKWRIDALKEAAKYPGYSKPLTPRHYDALTRVEPQVVRGNGKKETGPQAEDELIVQPGKLTYQAGEKPLMFVEVINAKSGAHSPLTVSAIMMRIVVNDGETPGSIGTMTFRDDGLEGDEKAGDLRYTGTPLPSQLATLRGQIHVDVRAILPDGRERHVLSSFRYGSPGARLTGQFSDYLEGGHLMLEAKVEVTKPGRYHLQAGLVGPGGENTVWSQVATELTQTGAQTMKLKFYGLAFLAADVPGPYTVKFISIAETGVRPVVQGTVMENVYTTKAYTLADFSAEPNKDPAMDEIIGQAEALTKMPVTGAAASGGPKDPKPEKTKPPTEPPPGYDPNADPK